MILTGDKIKNEVKNGNIIISPFIVENVNPNSYNYRLAPEIIEIDDSYVLDAKKQTNGKKIKIGKRGYVLQPGRLYLGSTYEKIGSNNYVTTLIGRSSVGRLGLFLQITAPLGHVGSVHNWTLELEVVQPLRVYPYMKIGQVCFWNCFGDKGLGYNSKYTAFNNAHISEIYKEFNNNDSYGK